LLAFDFTDHLSLPPTNPTRPTFLKNAGKPCWPQV